LAIFNNDASRRRVTEVLRAVRPDVVMTASPVDYMCDHEATSRLVRDACFAAPAPNYATSAVPPAPALSTIPHLYFMDPIGGVDRENRPVLADFYVDIGLQFETKRAMLAEHASQREWLLAQHGMDDYLLTMERWTREAGHRAGVVFAEGFRHYKGIRTRRHRCSKTYWGRRSGNPRARRGTPLVHEWMSCPSNPARKRGRQSSMAARTRSVISAAVACQELGERNKAKGRQHLAGDGHRRLSERSRKGSKQGSPTSKRNSANPVRAGQRPR
jgi:hypothetical protein